MATILEQQTLFDRLKAGVASGAVIIQESTAMAPAGPGWVVFDGAAVGWKIYVRPDYMDLDGSIWSVLQSGAGA
jgi:hypothetical protein